MPFERRSSFEIVGALESVLDGTVGRRGRSQLHERSTPEYRIFGRLDAGQIEVAEDGQSAPDDLSKSEFLQAPAEPGPTSGLIISSFARDVCGEIVGKRASAATLLFAEPERIRRPRSLSLGPLRLSVDDSASYRSRKGHRSQANFESTVRPFDPRGSSTLARGLLENRSGGGGSPRARPFPELRRRPGLQERPSLRRVCAGILRPRPPELSTRNGSAGVLATGFALMLTAFGYGDARSTSTPTTKRDAFDGAHAPSWLSSEERSKLERHGLEADPRSIVPVC